MSVKLHKPELVHKEYRPPKGCVDSFVLRELTAEDELQAAMWAKIKNGTDPQLCLGEENLRVSIVAVNGENVEQPYLGMDSWTMKTRRYLAEAWSELNGVDEDSLEVFLKAGKVMGGLPAEKTEGQ